jgi:hypothetical protein
MVLSRLAAVLAVGCTSLAVARADSTGPDECAAQPCRPQTTITIPAGADSLLTYQVDRSPYLTDEKHIVIEPGEKLVFRFSPQNGQPGDPTFVRAEAVPPEVAPDLSDPAYDKMNKSDVNTYASAVQKAYDLRYGYSPDRLQREEPNTFIITYRAVPGTVGMMMTVEHNLSKRLKYVAFEMLPKEGGWTLKYTNTCSIKPNGSVIENWPIPIGGMILEKFTFLKDGEPDSCE